MLAYQKVLKGILHVAYASLGEAGVTAQSSQPVATSGSLPADCSELGGPSAPSFHGAL